jgi:hypothetical protein
MLVINKLILITVLRSKKKDDRQFKHLSSLWYLKFYQCRQPASPYMIRSRPVMISASPVEPRRKGCGSLVSKTFTG